MDAVELGAIGVWVHARMQFCLSSSFFCKGVNMFFWRADLERKLVLLQGKWRGGPRPAGPPPS
eukprot:scaffold402323_cov17-Prasinocladus_malaysianus.AAC.1